MLIDTKKDEEEDLSNMTKYERAKRKCGKCWEKFLFRPKDPFKIKWDIFVIILSIWNAI